MLTMQSQPALSLAAMALDCQRAVAGPRRAWRPSEHRQREPRRASQQTGIGGKSDRRSA